MSNNSEEDEDIDYETVHFCFVILINIYQIDNWPGGFTSHISVTYEKQKCWQAKSKKSIRSRMN